MELLYSFPLWIFVLLVSLSFRFLSNMYKPTIDGQLPPGRRGWPVIGESIEFFSTGRKGHPEKFIFDRMTKFSPQVFKTSLMLQNVAVFCGSTGNKFLFSNENKLVRIWMPTSIDKLFPSTSQMAVARSINIFRKVINPEALHRYIPVMDMVAHKHFAVYWEGRDTIMTYDLIKDFTLLLACKIFLSIEEPDLVKFLSGPLRSVGLGMFSIPIDLPGISFRRGINEANVIRKKLIAIIKQRKIDLEKGEASPTQDILSHMILFRDEDGKFMPENEVADDILGFLIGGQDSTSSTCVYIVKYLAEFPNIYKRIYKEQTEIAKSKSSGELLNWEDVSKMKHSWNVACEVLRIIPPVQGSFREAITDIKYNGYSIPKGWKLYWNAHSTHKNPKFFQEPEKFDPSRFEGKGPAPYTFVPFGGGPHTCPGKGFARLLILVFIHHLVTKFKWEKVIPNERTVVNPFPFPANGLPVRLYPHKV